MKNLTSYTFLALVAFNGMCNASSNNQEYVPPTVKGTYARVAPQPVTQYQAPVATTSAPQPRAITPQTTETQPLPSGPKFKGTYANPAPVNPSPNNQDLTTTPLASTTYGTPDIYSAPSRTSSVRESYSGSQNTPFSLPGLSQLGGISEDSIMRMLSSGDFGQYGALLEQYFGDLPESGSFVVTNGASPVTISYRSRFVKKADGSTKTSVSGSVKFGSQTTDFEFDY